MAAINPVHAIYSRSRQSYCFFRCPAYTLKTLKQRIRGDPRERQESKLVFIEKKRICVFDLDAEDCDQTADAIGQHFEKLQARVEIVKFTDKTAFTYDFRDNKEAGRPYDMSFVGVDSMIGVEAAIDIRSQDARHPIFLVSRGNEYASEGFRLCALDYLIKPVWPARAGRAIRRINE